MELIIVLAVLMIFVIFGVLIYIIYDYTQYKKNVDNVFSNYVWRHNGNYGNINSNIDTLSERIRLNTNTITNNFNSNIQQINTYNENLKKFDSSLKNFFEFSDNNNKINSALYEYNFTKINPNLKLIKDTIVDSSITILTDKENKKQFNICDNAEKPNCINIDVSPSEGFNIKPMNKNISFLNIKNENNDVMASFNYKTGDILLGGNNNETSGIRINKTDVFMSNVNFKNPLENKNIILNYEKLNNLYNITQNIICNYHIVSLRGINVLTINFSTFIDIPINSMITFSIPEITVINDQPNINYLFVKINNVEDTNSPLTVNMSKGKEIKIRNNILIPMRTNISLGINSGFTSDSDIFNLGLGFIEIAS